MQSSFKKFSPFAYKERREEKLKKKITTTKSPVCDCLHTYTVRWRCFASWYGSVVQVIRIHTVLSLLGVIMYECLRCVCSPSSSSSLSFFFSCSRTWNFTDISNTQTLYSFFGMIGVLLFWLYGCSIVLAVCARFFCLFSYWIECWWSSRSDVYYCCETCVSSLFWCAFELWTKNLIKISLDFFLFD